MCFYLRGGRGTQDGGGGNKERLIFFSRFAVENKDVWISPSVHLCCGPICDPALPMSVVDEVGLAVCAPCKPTHVCTGPTFDSALFLFAVEVGLDIVPVGGEPICHTPLSLPLYIS